MKASKLFISSFLGLVLMFTCTPLMAAWDLVVDGDEDTLFIDKSTIQKSDSTLKVWVLGNHKGIECLKAGTYCSLKSLMEIDCAGRLSRIISAITYNEHMGHGEVINDEPNTHDEWSDLAPETQGWAIYEKVCQIQSMPKLTIISPPGEENVRYIDFSKVRKSGNNVTFWMLQNYKKPQENKSNGIKYLSVMSQFDIDCKDEVYAIKAIRIYTENMGAGALVGKYTTQDPEWIPIVPETNGIGLDKVLCHMSNT